MKTVLRKQPAGYRNQYDRMMRYYAKFAEVDEGRDHNESVAHYEDDVYAFFINCYHLKDWIKNDPAITAKFPPIGIDIEAFIGNAPHGNEYLRRHMQFTKTFRAWQEQQESRQPEARLINYVHPFGENSFDQN